MPDQTTPGVRPATEQEEQEIRQGEAIALIKKAIAILESKRPGYYYFVKEADGK